MSTATDSNFVVRNTLVVNTAFWANSTGLYFGSSPTLSMNSTTYQGTANNASFLGGASYTVYPNTSGNFTMGGKITFSANTLHNANLAVNAFFIANGSAGTSNTVLTSNAGIPYWGSIQASWVSGLATSATTDTTNASNITTGQIGVARISGLATSATTDTTNAQNISTGTLSNARLANVVFCNVSGQQINGGGVRVTPYTIASGNATFDSGNGPQQYYLNNQVATLTAPSNDGSLVLFINNAAAANTLTFSGFNVNSGNYGDPYNLTANNKFLFYINRTNSISTYICKAMQ